MPTPADLAFHDALERGADAAGLLDGPALDEALHPFWVDYISAVICLNGNSDLRRAIVVTHFRSLDRTEQRRLYANSDQSFEEYVSIIKEGRDQYYRSLAGRTIGSA